MEIEDIARSMQRVVAVLSRKPQAGLHEDTAATARWDGGLHVTVHSPAGHAMATDMPVEIGGEAGAPSPGWLVRAGLASCAATRIAMAAAAAGIRLDTLEVRATSESDLRGLLEITGADGRPVPAGPLTMGMAVRIGASGIPAERLHALVMSIAGCSPVTSAIEQALPVSMQVEVVY